MIGRHHARLQQASSRVTFMGAVDPGGDRFGALLDPEKLFSSLDELLDRARPDFAVISVPTEEHLATAAVLADAGVHMLVEKPLAATVEEGKEIIRLCRDQGVKAAVGHVERFNPALLELRRRVDAGEIGQVFMVQTTRVGPFPDRIKDVGVVKDLATHDLDLVRWLGGSPITVLAAQTQHKTGRPHEDLVFITGGLDNGVSFNSAVDWLTPTKVRTSRLLGDRGLLEANTLTGDLTFYANGQVSSEWDSLQALRGVSEEDMIRYALERREPLLVELEAFCDYVTGDDASAAVRLEDGLEAVRVAEAVLQSATDQVTARL